jgi:hypothetical protein
MSDPIAYEAGWRLYKDHLTDGNKIIFLSSINSVEIKHRALIKWLLINALGFIMSLGIPFALPAMGKSIDFTADVYIGTWIICVVIGLFAIPAKVLLVKSNSGSTILFRRHEPVLRSFSTEITQAKIRLSE